MFKTEGSFVALITPYAGDPVDLAKVRELVDFHLENGTSGFCPVATTGESPSLSREEKAAVIRAVVERARGKALVFPGAGTYNTRETIEQTRMARELGADGALLVTPYYNKPTQEGLYRHYEAVARAVPGFPLMLYNVPGRTGVSLAPETTARLSRIPGIVAIKDASGNVEQVTQVRALCDIQILSGEDSLTFPILCLGGCGVVSVAANIVPRAVADLCQAVRAGELARARQIHERYFPLFKDLFLETNPIPVKTALRLMGRYTGELRLPLCEMSRANAERLEKTLRACQVI
ncbi:MAG: 4-hydroxy-tetrahydrodipicolinate synthase [Planctomycetota bacterium]